MAWKFISNLLIENRCGNWELKLAVTKLRDGLFHFEFCLRRLFTVLYSFFPTKSKFRENLIKTEQSFIKDLNNHFKKL